VLDLGVATDRIIFANPCKMQSHVAYAASVGVNLTTFDSESEVPSPIPLLPSQTAFSAGFYHSGMFLKPE